MKFDNNKAIIIYVEKIILAPSNMHKTLLFNLRKEDLFTNPKILTKEEFLGKYYGKVTTEGLYYIFKNKDFNYPYLQHGAKRSDNLPYGIYIQKCKNYSFYNENNCNSLERLDVSNWDTSNVTNM